MAGDKATAGIFATYPQPFLSAVPGGFVDQVVGTALLLLVIFALGDRRNAGPASGGPVLVGALVVLIGMTFGFNAGYAINPARDLGPRLFTAIAGWGSEVFRAGGGWWWVPIVAPCLGALLGGFVYDRLITRHHPPETRLTRAEPPPAPRRGVARARGEPADAPVRERGLGPDARDPAALRAAVEGRPLDAGGRADRGLARAQRASRGASGLHPPGSRARRSARATASRPPASSTCAS